MLVQEGFPGRRIVQIKGRGTGRKAAVEEADFITGMWSVTFDGTSEPATVNPADFKADLEWSQDKRPTGS